MNKRGLSALMVDGFAILFLIVFVIAMLLIFKYSIHPYEASMSTSASRSIGFITVRNLLTAEAEYEGFNWTLQDLIVICGVEGCDWSDPLSKLINTTLADAAREFNLELLRFSVKYGRQRPSLSFIRDNENGCEPMGGELTIAPFGPVDEFGKGRIKNKERWVNVTIVFCG